jgi:hypothetical protein
MLLGLPGVVESAVSETELARDAAVGVVAQALEALDACVPWRVIARGRSEEARALDRQDRGVDQEAHARSSSRAKPI